MIVKGPACYADVRTYGGTFFDTFKEACAARGLLGDDNEWYHAFDTALCSATCHNLDNFLLPCLSSVML